MGNVGSRIAVAVFDQELQDASSGESDGSNEA